MTQQLEIFNRSWTWHGEPESAPVELRGRAAADMTPVKANPVRSVYFFQLPSGPGFYLKYDHPTDLAQRCKAFFYRKVQREYAAAQRLERKRIPVVKYLGWGQSGSDGLLISRALPEVTGGKEYWFRVVGTAVDQQRHFLALLSGLARQVIDAGLYHPDFHIGNVLVDAAGKQVTLVDPYGIRSVGRLTPGQRLQMIKILIDFRGELAPAIAQEWLLDAGLATTEPEAESMWRQAIDAEEREIADGWPKRRQQILSGHSKFSTAVKRAGAVWHIRHTMWYQGPARPEQFQIDPQWQVEELSGEEARERWLESFRRQLLRQPGRRPLLWIQQEHDRDLLYYQD